MELSLQMKRNFEETVKEVFNDFFDEEPMNDDVRSVMDEIIANGPEALVSIDDYNKYMEKQYMNVLRMMVAMCLGLYKESISDDNQKYREKVSKYFEPMVLQDAEDAPMAIDGVMQGEIIDNLFEMFSDSLDR